MYLIQVGGVWKPVEVYCLERVQHVQGVIRLLDHYTDVRHCRYVVVMDRLTNSQDLFDYITQRGRLHECEARYVMSQLVDAVGGLDRAGVVHRDIKDENIIIDISTKQLRLIDFGSAACLAAAHPPFTHFDGHHCSLFVCSFYMYIHAAVSFSRKPNLVRKSSSVVRKSE